MLPRSQCSEFTSTAVSLFCTRNKIGTLNVMQVAVDKKMQSLKGRQQAQKNKKINR